MNSVKKYFQVLIVVGLDYRRGLRVQSSIITSYIFSRRVKGVVEQVERVHQCGFDAKCFKRDAESSALFICCSY